MTQSIGIFDSNDDGSIKSIVNKHTDSTVLYGSPKGISNQLESLSNNSFLSSFGNKKKEYRFYLIHQSDVDDLPDKVSQWIEFNRSKIVLYSGGATGEDGVFQRAEIHRNLEDFILKVEANEADPLQAFRKQALRSILQWSHLYQHEFGNLYAPLDYLSLLYQGGDVKKDVYSEIKGKLQSRIRSTLESKKHTNKKWDDIFKKGDEAFGDIDSVEFKSGEYFPISRFASFPIIHIDDEIDKGWDLVFPAVFGDKYIHASTPEEGLAEIEKHAGSSCVVLLDLRMPNKEGNQPDKETGLATLREIREKWPLLPVYVFSANTDYESYGDAIRAGASGYLVKFARSLETRADSVLYRELWEVMRSSRLANISHCLYSVFSSIESHENFVSLSHSLKWRIEGAFIELSQVLQSISFDSLVTDDNQSSSHARYLLIILYKTLEHLVHDPGKESVSTPIKKFDFIIDLPRSFRNRSAHNNDKVNKQGRIFPGVREVLLSASLLITKWGELLNDEEWTRQQLDWLLSIMLINTLDRQEVKNRIKEAEYYDSGEIGLEPIKNFLRKSNESTRHRIVEILAVDCLDSKNLNDGSYFNWFNADSLCPIDYAFTRSSSAQADLPMSDQTVNVPNVVASTATNLSRSDGVTKYRGLKLLGDLFELQEGQYFHRMNKYNGLALDLENPEQVGYLQWYFDDHIHKNPNRYSKEVYSKFKEWLSNAKPEVVVQPEDPNRIGNDLDELSLDVLCVDITSLGESYSCDIIIDLVLQENPTWIPRIRKRQKDSLYRPPASNRDRQVLKGFRINNPLSVAGKIILPVSPSTMTFDTSADIPFGKWVFDGNEIWKYHSDSVVPTSNLNILEQGSHPSSMQEAKTAFNDVFQVIKKSISSVSGPIPWNQVGKRGQFNEVTLVDDRNNKFNLNNVNTVIRRSLDGIKLAVLDKTDHQTEANELKNCLSGSVGRPEWVNNVGDSEAFIALIPKELNDNQIEELISELDNYGKPYVVVNPGSFKYKTFGIAVGLRARLSKPLWSLSGRKPQRLFIGLDVGTRQGSGSILAASCIDHTGRLLAWCRVKNTGGGTGPERINPNTFSRAISLIREKITPELKQSLDSYELVIHRDGKTLEDEQEYISILKDLGFTSKIEWVDVIKSGAPIISGNTSKKKGLYLHINNNRDMEQYWNMQSTQDDKKYIRPIVVEKIEGDSPLFVLASEVFYLSHVATHDYLGRQKLPTTTYYADGFSKSGADFLKFVGYEHLRAS